MLWNLATSWCCFPYPGTTRMVEEGLTAREAADAVLRDNLHCLEIDNRCCQNRGIRNGADSLVLSWIGRYDDA